MVRYWTGESGKVRHTVRWTGKRVAVVGLGVSNLPLARYLVQKGAQVVACDALEAEQLGERYDELARLPVEFRLGPGYLDGLRNFDAVFLTPGMPKDLPQIEEARAAGVEISSEMRLFFQLCRAPIIGVTGTSGKTTTTCLVAEIVEAAGHTVYLGGNIGRSLIEEAERIPPDAWVVLELSSFQLELLDRSPHIAVVTNLTPNHLDVHPSMEAYADAKRRIFAFQGEADWSVFNADQDATRAMGAEAPSQVRWFSRRAAVSEGAHLDGDRLMVVRETVAGRTLDEVCRVGDVKLLGAHNLENILASLVVGSLVGATSGTMRDVVASFTGVAHRLELVREAGGVQYYNDSIATTPDQAIAGIQAFDAPVVLIAGGYDKKLPFDAFAHVVAERVKTLVLVGQTAGAIESAVKAAAERRRRGPFVCRAESFDEAVRKAQSAAEPGDVVLLSPGCASYDMFRDFAERGERFRRIVHALTEETASRSNRG